MYLTQDEKAWTTLEEHRAVTVIRTLNDHLESTRSIKTALTYVGRHETLHSSLKSSGGKPPERTDHSELPVELIDIRPLPFYGEGWLLHRFSCVIDASPELAGYERIAHLFAVQAPSAARGTPQAASSDSCEWTLLDWTSSPLHQLNSRIDLDVSQLLPEHVRSYLVFFCSFLNGGEDVDYAPTPFLIPRSTKDFCVPHALPSLAEIAQKNNLRTFKPLPNVEDADTFDLPSSAASTETTTHVPEEKWESESASLDSFLRAIEEAFAAVKECNPPVTPIVDERGHEGSDTKAVLRYEGTLVWYRNTLYRADFLIKQNGAVSMDNDVPIAGTDTLPRLDVRQAHPPLPLLCREKPREQIHSDELLTRIRRSLAASDEAAGQELRLRGLRVNGDVVDAGAFASPVRLENIEFTGTVKFDDAVFERSLELLGCRFLRRLSTVNTKVKGAFRLNRSHCLGALGESTGIGATFSDPRRWPTLDLRGLEANGGVFADHLTVFGSMHAQWARIGGAMLARGLQIHHRGQNADVMQALDFSHAMIDGPLDLVGHAPRRDALGEAQRTFIGGVAVMQGLRARQADLRGIRVEDAYLDMGSCEISGTIDLGVLKFDDGSENGWRARLGTGLVLTHGRAGLVMLSGCAIGGPLTMIGLQLDNWLFARLNWCFRTKVDGDVTLSGARIQSDIDFGGAKVVGRFTFVTGHCGRLRLGAEPWLHHSGDALGICPTSVQSVLLMDLQVDAGIDVAGLCTTGPPSGERCDDDYVGGGFVALGTRLGGGLRFWREDADKRFHLQFADLSRKLRREINANAIERAINGICAHIGGKLDLRGIRTGGSINLGRCKVEHMIRLENARIGGNLRAGFGNGVTCSAAQFSADLACIEGNVDLSGLEVHSNLRACDSRIDGNVLLPTGPAGTHAQVGGAIWLAGLRAGASLIVSGHGLIERSKEDEEEDSTARIDLSRCQIGQLKTLGFEQHSGAAYRFGHRLNLLAIQVGDWRFDDNEQVRALLAKTEPFDACNYIDVEQRLARIGYKGLANRVYLDMKNRVYRERKTRLGNSEQSSKPKLIWLKKAWLGLKYHSDGWFSCHGTRPLLMLGWLLISMLPVIYFLSDHRNVEFALVERAGQRGQASIPVSNDRTYFLKDDWGSGKAIGLAVSYAIPFYGGARPEVVRARLNGPLCSPWKEPPACKPVSLLWKVSPHGFAMSMSVIQFFLWIFMAANLPTIIRRRS